jgi:hypothetical protein
MEPDGSHGTPTRNLGEYDPDSSPYQSNDLVAAHQGRRVKGGIGAESAVERDGAGGAAQNHARSTRMCHATG